MSNDLVTTGAHAKKVVAAAVLLLTGCGHAAPAIPPPEDVRTIRVWFQSLRDSDAPAVAEETDDRELIVAIVRLLETARSSDDHKCAGLGTMQLQLGSGSSVSLELLPGHDGAFYECRQDRKLYRMSRSEFMRLVGKLGVEDIPLGPAS